MADFLDIPPPPPLLNPMSARSLHFDEEEINMQKKCNPGPNVLFSKKGLPFSEYISSMSQPGTLGCNPDQYPKYTDGKYCCESTMATPQEQLDYVNMLLEYAIENVGETAFKKYSREINWLNSKRDFLLKKYKENNLRDSLIEHFPMTINGEDYENLNDYISKNMQISNELARDYQYKTTIEGEGLEDRALTRMNTSENKKNGLITNNQENNDGKEGGKGYRKTMKRRRSRKARRKSHRKSHRRGGRRRSKRLTKK
jgi:hypothetical protein